MMTKTILFPTLVTALLTFASCSAQEPAEDINDTPVETTAVADKQERHQYGGWYCPDNFGFVPVDIQRLYEVPAIADRLPTEQELKENKSLIKVDTDKFPDARALPMDLPRLARVYSEHNGMDELIIVIQAIVVQEDTVVGYRFPNGGNGSAWISDVEFVDNDELREMGSQPFFYSSAVVKATKEEIWKAFTETSYAEELGEKFDKEEFFASEWTEDSKAHLERDEADEVATGFVGTVFGNAYLHIDYDRDGFHYSEKLLMVENKEDQTTELFFACGPFPNDFPTQRTNWTRWYTSVKKAAEKM